MLNILQLKAIYNNEQVLMVLFARLYFLKCNKQHVDDFIANEPVDWNVFSKMASMHGVSSFIYYVAEKYKITIQRESAELFKKNHNTTRFKNFTQLKATSALVIELKNNGVTCIPYKGASFAFNYYAELGLRESSDIDLMISRSSLKLTEDYLIKEKFKPIDAVPRPYLNYYSKIYKDIVYVQPAFPKNNLIEIHYRLMDRCSGEYPGFDFFEQHLVEHKFGDIEINTLSPTYDFLAVISNHFIKDMNSKFKYLVDIACLIQKEGKSLDLQVINDCAKKYCFQKKLNIGLESLKQLLGFELFEHAPVKLSAEDLEIPLKYPMVTHRSHFFESEFLNRSFKLQDSLYHKLTFSARCFLYLFLPNKADINAFKLPIVVSPLLVILRPLRLAQVSIKSVLDRQKARAVTQ
jgi:hypothetical protein